MIAAMMDKITQTYSFASQREIFVEECAEAIQAAQKIKREGSPEECDTAFEHFCEEVADVLNTAEQMRYFCGADKIDKIRAAKLQRQLERIERAET